jgi:PhzF family phenazine biosynthesis protein
MRYFIVDAFTDRPFGGNPAGVVLLEGDSFPEEELMLHIAAELRYSETAFVRRHSESEYTVRYFTPAAEVELCGHATIATFALLRQMQMAEGECMCHTLAGDLRIEAGEKVLMQMATPRIVKTISDIAPIYHALGLDGYRPSLPIQVAYAGLADIMIPVADVATLNSLQPDMEAISAITRENDAVSFHLFALAGDGYTAHVRDFAPLYGVPEESATGTANAALTHYLVTNKVIPPHGDFTFMQGEAMQRSSVVATRISPDGTIYVGGRAYLLASGELRIEN